jgi:DNA-binding transcriptional MocR family regulator
MSDGSPPRAPEAPIEGRTARQITASVESRIRDGRVQPGERLPTIRGLAADLGVSTMTVATAYRELRRRGLVSSAGRRGTRVSEAPPLPVAYAPFVPSGVRDLATGNPDPDLLPPLHTALTQLDSRPRVHPFGNKAQRLAERAEATFAADGIATPALAVVAGALDGVERVLAAHLFPGDAIAVEDPTFTRIADLVRSLGLNPAPVGVDDDGLLPDELARTLSGGAKALVLTPRWQNPYGSHLTAERAHELAAVLDEHEDVLVIEDDHAGLISQEHAYTVSSGRKRWATVRSVSKAMGADLRLAVMAGDRATVARVEGRQLLATGWVSHVLQELVANLWTDPAVQARIKQAASIYCSRRRRLIEALAARGIASYGASGLNVWIPVAEEAATVAGMLHRGWAIMAGERWRLRSGPAVRITASTLDSSEADAVADDLVAVLERRPGAFAS